MNRRQFVKTAAGAAVPVALTADAMAQEPAVRPNDPGVLTDALLDFAKNRFGQHLTEEQTRSLRLRILRNLGNAAVLRAMPLTNGDEPDSTFITD